MASGTDQGAEITRELAGKAARLRFEDLPSDVVETAAQCVLDWTAVTLAGSREPLAALVADEVAEGGGRPEASVIGRAARTSVLQAALANGAASHALDYDDAHLLAGHPTCPVMPAALAAGEKLQASGRDLLSALVAGIETACRVGAMTQPGHYALGFHTTATLGTFGAAAAGANLLRLEPEAAARALGIAGTEAAGLKSVFGTMCKPLHAGRAAQAGLLAARLAARGFTARSDILECPQGFVATHGPDARFDDARAEPSRGFHILDTLFKFHAACYLTHAAIEGARALRLAHDLVPDAIDRVVVRTHEGADGICNIARPVTGLEAKFSLRLTTAFALAGLDTAEIDVFSDANAADPELAALRDRVTVEFAPRLKNTEAEVEIVLADGRRFSGRHDTGIPTNNLARQRTRLEGKFLALATPVLGDVGAVRLLAMLGDIPALDDVGRLAAACTLPPPT